MDNTIITYNTLTKIELIDLCKKRNIRGYASFCRSKENIIQLLNKNDLAKKPIEEDYNNMKYETLLALCRERKVKGYFGKSSTGKVIATKEMMIKSLEENIVRKSLFDYLTENNPSLITKFVGNKDDLKIIPHGTNKKYIWKCNNSECLNTFEAIPNLVYKSDLPKIYCNSCSKINKKVKYNIRCLERSGSIQQKFPNIVNVWSKENKNAPSQICAGSNKKVILECPYKPARHPEYKITVNKIQENNYIRCPKCVKKTSNAEMIIYSELKYVFKDVKWQQKIEGREADITIEDLKLVIEVDGFPWHINKLEKDLAKNVIFENNGYSVLRVRDLKLGEILCNTVVCNVTNLSLTDYNKIVEWINIKFKCNIIIYNEWKNTEYYKELQISTLSIPYEKSLEYLFPESKNIWDYEQNYPFIPSQFTKCSDVEMWIKCSNGHSWKRKLSHLFRTINYKKKIMCCPECSKLKPEYTNNLKINKKCVTVNGISYESISDCCRNLKIDRNKLYTKMKRDKLDNKIIADIGQYIEQIVNIINV